MPDILELAEQNGFEYTAPLCMAALVPMSEVREMCAAGRCRQYNRSWSCPPPAAVWRILPGVWHSTAGAS